tara:strand:+ start:6635 stop:7360 length:726 start_codon:yes stop_codon:yes gene_type:complete
MTAVTMGGSIMMGALMYGRELYHFLKPRRVGVYGPTMVGKTTLDRFMTTPGEMEDVEDRTLHPKRLIGHGHVLPRASRKRVRWENERRVVQSTDLGGQQRFWNLWLNDMVERRVEIVIFLTDDRALGKENKGYIDVVGGLEFLTDAVIERRWKYRTIASRLRGKRYAPKQIWVIANKADIWWDDKANLLWQSQRLREHHIFNAHRPAMVRLQKAGIPCRVNMMATKIGWNVEKTLMEMLKW